MPLQATSGAASYDGFGGGVAAVPNYIEDVFSTWLIKPSADYTTYSINNGVDLSTKGGMTWFKARDAAQNNLVYDTARGSSSGSPNALVTNNTNAQQTAYFDYVTPNTNGFTVNYLSGGGQLTNSGINYASWTFRKQPKFFDVVTYTGNGSSTQVISHSLGSAAGCVIVKPTNTTGDWFVYHASIATGIGSYTGLKLNTTGYGEFQRIGNVTNTTFEVQSAINASGDTYVAYLFAHNAGGFGLTGTDNVISCGSYTGSSSSDTVVNLGYEPQFVMIKKTNGSDNWLMFDSMRGLTVKGQKDAYLWANSSNYENQFWGASDYLYPTATGFALEAGYGEVNADGFNYIYIAIRRGPMKVPTSGTSVFSPIAITPTNNAIQSMNFVSDMNWARYRDLAGNGTMIHDRLRGFAYGTATSGSQYPETGLYLQTTTTSAENNNINPPVYNVWNNQLRYGDWAATTPTSFYNFGRAPSFFDEVCYTGDSTARTVTHNLQAVPELIICKNRTNNNGNQNWQVYSANLGNTSRLQLNTTDSVFTGTFVWNNTSPTSSVFSLATSALVNGSGDTYVAYLFATCAGVQYINSYVGDGTTGRTINCGFTGGARFVCIKATSTTGSWWTFDSARGIVTNNDPALQLNSTAAEVTSADAIDTASSGFIVNQEATCSLNASGVTYLVWAIA